jgi:hypothetical protein
MDRTQLTRTELKRSSNIAESFLYQASAFRFHAANLDLVRYRIGDSTHREDKPARNISHPREELDKVSSWVSSATKTPDVVINKLRGVILPVFYGRLIINNSQNRRRGGTANMLIPFGRAVQPIRSENESLFDLRLMENINNTLVESLMGGLAHSTPASDEGQCEAWAQIQRLAGARTCHCIGKRKQRNRLS